MAITPSDLQAKRDSIIAEIAKGNSALQSGSGSVTKRSILELQRALAIIDDELAATGSPQRLRRTVITTSKGL